MAERRGIAILTYATQPRGGVVHAVALAEALFDRGEDVVLYALDDGRGFARAPRCPYRLVAVPRDDGSDLHAFVTARAEAYVRALSSATERRFAVYHAQDGISANALATLVDRAEIATFARTVHHLDAFSDPRVAAAQDRSVRRAGGWFVVSDVWAATLRERFGAEATVVGNGVDTERFSQPSPPAREALRLELGLDGADTLFLAIGGVEKRKNALGTLEAFALVRARSPRARLAIAGGASVFDHGPYRDAFVARRDALGLAGCVEILGERSDEQIVASLRAADALVFASLAEGFGLVTLEALACGLPIVVSDIEPFRSYLPEQLASFVDPERPASIADGMRRATEPASVARARAEGPAFAAGHPWSRVAELHLAGYARVAGANSGELQHA